MATVINVGGSGGNAVNKNGDTMTGALIAASGDVTVAQVRNVYFGTAELTDGSASSYPEGTIYFQYE